MENPCDESLIRGAAAALAWSFAAIIVDMVRSGAVFMSISPGRRAESARFGYAQGDRSLRRAVAISMVGEGF